MAAMLIHNVDLPDPPLTFAKVTTLTTLESFLISKAPTFDFDNTVFFFKNQVSRLDSF